MNENEDNADDESKSNLDELSEILEFKDDEEQEVGELAFDTDGLEKESQDVSKVEDSPEEEDYSFSLDGESVEEEFEIGDELLTEQSSEGKELKESEREDSKEDTTDVDSEGTFEKTEVLGTQDLKSLAEKMKSDDEEDTLGSLDDEDENTEGEFGTSEINAVYDEDAEPTSFLEDEISDLSSEENQQDLSEGFEDEGELFEDAEDDNMLASEDGTLGEGEEETLEGVEANYTENVEEEGLEEQESFDNTEGEDFEESGAFENEEEGLEDEPFGEIEEEVSDVTETQLLDETEDEALEDIETETLESTEEESLVSPDESVVFDKSGGSEQEGTLKITSDRQKHPPVFHEGEAVRLQATIRQLREEREELLKEIKNYKYEMKLNDQGQLGLRAELDEAKIEVSILKKRHSVERDEMKYRLRVSDEKKLYAEEKVKKLQKEFDRLQGKVRLDFNHVRQREKELEGQLELVKMDSESQVKTRDKKILELKRKIDQLEFNMENIVIREQKSRDDKVKLEERLEKMMKTLRGSIEVLEDDIDLDGERKG